MNLAARSAVPITSAGLLLRNLSHLLDKKEGSISDLEAVLSALIGCHSEEGTVLLDRILMDWVLRYLVIIAGVQTVCVSNISKLAMSGGICE